MAINPTLGQLPPMANDPIDPFVKGLEIAMATDGWKMKPLSERAGMGESAVRDLFRKSSSPKVSTAAALAKALGRSIDEIIAIGQSGQAPTISAPTKAAAPRGFSEPAATPFEFREFEAREDEPQPGLRRIFGPMARSPATIQLNTDIPGLHVSCGDVLVMDLSRLPTMGEICVIQIEQENGDATLAVRRYLPPYLISADAGPKQIPLTVDDPMIIIKHPIIGVLRGLPKD